MRLVRPTATRQEMSVPLAPRLFLLLLEASLLLSGEARKPADDANFGNPIAGVFRYRDASGSESLYCIFVSPRFKRPPYKENDSFREAVFHYANQSCDLGLEKSSNKHVILMLPEDENSCPFELSLSQAVSAHAYSLVVARNFDLKSHLAYFTPESDVLVPSQDIILAEMQLKTVEKFKPKNMTEWSAVAANGSAFMGPAAKLYLVHVYMATTSIVLCILACSTVAVGGALGREHQEAAPKPADDIPSSDEEPLNEESYFGDCPINCNLVTLFVLAIAVNLLMMYYFSSKMWPILVGCIAIGAMISLVILFDSIAFLIPCASTRVTNFMFPCFVRSMELRHHIVIWLAVSIPIVWVVFRKSEHAWILQDFLGSAFAINILRCVHFPNFKIITLISVLLFFDDIFMVFITSLLTKDVSVMESVALGVQDLPVLMRVPYFFPGESAVCNGNIMFLGYGDIAVPGLAVAYCRSYDVIVKKGVPWYFLLAIVCYAAGLVMAMTASRLMNTGQPALLYLIPAILLPVILLAWCRGDLKKFWSGDFVPKEGLMSARMDVCVSSSEQFQMIQGPRTALRQHTCVPLAGTADARIPVSTNVAFNTQPHLQAKF
ncbi:hypothetical protein MTO96_006018 [Rhipicephalus appendiculatus]